jgi:hypothetical protein
LLLGKARRVGLWPRLSCLLRDLPLTEAWLADQLESGRTVAQQQQRQIRWEVDRIRWTLAHLGVKVVLLKGGAYVMSQLPTADGRIVSDVDILVPKERLADVERAFLENNWEPLKQNEYDDHYYRDWMHELPPLRHVARETCIDVHHTILPPTGRLHPDPHKLLAAARPLGDGALFVLAPEDMVLHSAAHLFQDGDLAGGLRDLVDLDSLFRHFGATEDGFWDRLVPRARELELARPLFYALRFTRRLLQTPTPESVLVQAAVGGPRWPVSALMDSMVTCALLPGDDDGTSAGGAISRWLLYLRSHWLKMPPLLLMRHLGYKAIRRWFPLKDAQ